MCACKQASMIIANGLCVCSLQFIAQLCHLNSEYPWKYVRCVGGRIDEYGTKQFHNNVHGIRTLRHLFNIPFTCPNGMQMKKPHHQPKYCIKLTSHWPKVISVVILLARTIFDWCAMGFVFSWMVIITDSSKFIVQLHFHQLVWSLNLLVLCRPFSVWNSHFRWKWVVPRMIFSQISRPRWTNFISDIQNSESFWACRRLEEFLA